jgi:anti-sigma regulatory factor (Ser/Thr protein kinase)
MTRSRQWTLQRDLSSYLPVAQDVETFCAGHGLPKSTRFNVCLIVEELVLNQIDHATGPATDCLDLRIDVEPSRVVIVLEDDADPYDPRLAPVFDKTRPLEDRGPRGMGLQLVRSMAEEVEYGRVNGRNRLQVAIPSN